MLLSIFHGYFVMVNELSLNNCFTMVYAIIINMSFLLWLHYNDLEVVPK